MLRGTAAVAAVVGLLTRPAFSLEISGASRSESECAACNLIAQKLQDETQGSPIFSEMRRDEVIEGMCKGVGDYVGTAKDGLVKYTKPRTGKDGKPVIDLGSSLDLSSLMGGGMMGGGGGGLQMLQEMTGAGGEAKSKALKNFCAQLVEAHEDELLELLGRGSSSLHEDVCVNTVSKCSNDAVKAYLEDAKAHPEDHEASPHLAQLKGARQGAGKAGGKKKGKKGKKGKKAKGKEEL